jgi:hypothetical protein
MIKRKKCDCHGEDFLNVSCFWSGKTYLEKLLGEHIISLIDTGNTAENPVIK